MKRYGLVETKQPGMGQVAARGVLQRNANGATTSMETSPLVHQLLRSSGDPIDHDTRSFMEPRFGHDFSRVRVHTDAEAAASARAVDAQAYTVGRDVVFDNGRYAPQTSAGRRLLAHELAHVVQQSGDTSSSSSSSRDLGITRASDGVEAEARSAAAAVASGGVFRPQIRSGIVVARQRDAGVSADAGPSPAPDAGAPADAGSSPGPDAGSGAPAPASPPKSPAAPGGPAAPAPGVTATIAGVTFGGSTDRIPPTKTATAAVTVTGLPAGGSVKVDVEGSGGANGTATITAGAVLAGSGSVTVRGDNQTAPGNAGKLNLRATVGSTVVGRSPGFTVAAWPTNVAIARNADVDTPLEVGLEAITGWISDGSGARRELDETEVAERVDIARRDNPPFTTPGAISATPGGTAPPIAGNSLLTVDVHNRERAIIDTYSLSTGVFRQVYRQNFLFNDRRTGVSNMVVPNSGFTITHSVFVVGRGSDLSIHQTEKTGAAVSVEGRAATAGTGTATSNPHFL